MLQPKKSLGQNFLIDKNIIKKIVLLGKIKNSDVFEIGPGTGNLTNEILKFVRRNELLSVAHLHGVDAEVVELIATPNSEIVNNSLEKLSNYFQKNNILVGGVEQDGVWRVAVGTTEIEPYNKVVAVCTSQNLNKVRQLFN